MGKGKGQASKPKTGEEDTPSSSKAKGRASDKVVEQPRRSNRKRKISNGHDDNQVVPSAVPSTPEQNGGSGSTQPKPSTSAAARKSQRVSVSKTVVLSRPSIIDHDTIILDVVNEGLFPTQDFKFKEFDASILGILDHQHDLGLSEQDKEKWEDAVAQIISIRNVYNERRRTGRDIAVPETTAEKSVQTLNEVENVSTQVTGKDLGGKEVISRRLNGKGDQAKSKQRQAQKGRVNLKKAHIISCIFCEKQLPDNSKLESHLTSHTQERSYLCQRCPAEFSEQRAATSHYREAHSKKRKYFKCKMCTKSFLWKSSLTNHIRKHTGKCPLKCPSPGCKMRFATYHDRRHHFLKVHMGKQFSCDVCGNKFLTKSDLTQHLKRHSDFKAFNCKLCGASYKRKRNLNQHERALHPNK